MLQAILQVDREQREGWAGGILEQERPPRQNVMLETLRDYAHTGVTCQLDRLDGMLSVGDSEDEPPKCPQQGPCNHPFRLTIFRAVGSASTCLSVLHC